MELQICLGDSELISISLLSKFIQINSKKSNIFKKIAKLQNGAFAHLCRDTTKKNNNKKESRNYMQLVVQRTSKCLNAREGKKKCLRDEHKSCCESSAELERVR